MYRNLSIIYLCIGEIMLGIRLAVLEIIRNFQTLNLPKFTSYITVVGMIIDET